jgi:hypothetical protein
MSYRSMAWVAWTALVLAAVGCAEEEHLQPRAPSPALHESFAPRAADIAGVPAFVVSDATSRSSAFVLSLGPSQGSGIILDGRRLVALGGATRASPEVTDPPLVSAERLPRWLGGGFVFRSRTSLFASDVFDGPLRPVATFPSEIATLSFGPKNALVRAVDGQRWAIDLTSGARAPVSPPGVLDFAALGDGRAAAITEGGGALISADRGEHWVDITRQLTGRPSTVFALESPPDQAGVWLTETPGPAMRVDPGGRLSRFDRAPADRTDVRLPDPRWHGDEPPVRMALHFGVPVDARSAVVLAGGDVVRVDLVTGEILSLTPGRLPPLAKCEAVRTPDDIVFVCAHEGMGFVVSRAIGAGAQPVIEHAFAATGVFYAGDDGSLVFAGPCTGAKASPRVGCVRGAGGGWHEYNLESAGTVAAVADASAPQGPPSPQGEVVRWVPRADGSALAIVAVGEGANSSVGAVDARTGETRTWQLDALTPQLRAALELGRGRARDRIGRIVDRSWTASARGAVRAWTDSGVSVEIDDDGVASVSPFAFERVATEGPYAIAVSKGQRLWQSIDHGASWVEVLAPTVGRTQWLVNPLACSAVGCDLNAWYRLGWTATPPAAQPPLVTVAGPPRVARPPLPELLCKLAGEGHAASLPRGDRSPEDFGLGAMRLPVSDSENLVRTLFDRHGTNPAHAATAANAGSDYYTAPRVLLYGQAAQSGGNVVGLTRPLAFVAPFDTAAAVRKTGFPVSDLLSSGRAIGMQRADVLGDDPTAVIGVAPVATSDPAGVGDVVFFGSTGAVGLVRAGPPAKVKIVMRHKHGDEFEPVSAVATGTDELAILELDSNGSGHVIKVGPFGVSDLFDVPSPPQASLYPANVDALAVNSRGDLGVIRTPSGGDPPSAADPALLVVTGAPPVPLAPWATLASVDDEACRADTTGWHAIIQTVAPWIRLVGSEPEPDEDAPMLARVRWSAQRVCLEAVELRAADTALSSDSTVETWTVARLAAPAAAGKVTVVPGTEIRQPVQCALGPAR